MKKTYFSPAIRFIGLDAEGVIAKSPTIGLGKDGETLDTEDAWTNKKEQNLWGDEGIWK